MRDEGMGDCGFCNEEGQRVGQKRGGVKGGQGVGKGRDKGGIRAGLPMGVPPWNLQKPNKRTKETTCKRACVVSLVLLLLSVPRAGLEPAQPSLAKGF